MEDPGSAYSGIDNLSRLPDELLSRILSLLCTEDAVRTSVLSTRWRYLYTSISNLTLEFNSRILINSRILKNTDEQDCMNFVDRFLSYRKKCAFDKFELTWKMRQPLDPRRLENWIKVVLGHGIRELDLCIYVLNPKYLLLPSSLFTCKSLEVLKLNIWKSDSRIDARKNYGLELPVTVCLPSLKTIHLRNVNFSEDSWSRLFPNCPILEDIFYKSEVGYFKLSVSSPVLKRLTIEQEYGLFDVIVDAPSLVYLGVSNSQAQSLKLVNVRSLVEANIEVIQPGWFCNELMTGISNIQTLRISAASLRVLEGYLDRVPIPVLPNMTHLTIYACDSDLDSLLPYLLEKCESLETPVFEDLSCSYPYGLYYQEPRLRFLTSAVKTIKLCRFAGEKNEFQMVKYFLKKARALELIEIHLGSECENPSKIANELQKLPKNSEALMDVIF